MSEKFNYLSQYGNAHNPTKFGACIKNRTIQELCRRTITTRQRRTAVITPVESKSSSLKRLFKSSLYVWPVGLVAWFSLWVREVPGSTPGQARVSFLGKI